MRRKMMTSLVALILTLVVFVSYHSRGLLSYSETLTLALNSTAPQSLHEASNHALAELPPDPRRLRRSRPPEAVLLPDWEALVLLPSGANGGSGGGGGGEVSCLFSNGAASPARFAGSIPSSGRAAYRCVLPGGVRRLRPFHSPRLVVPGDGDGAGEEPSPEMLRWNRLAYESLSTPDDVLVFAKGVNTRSAAAEVRCVYYSVQSGGAATSSSAAAVSAAQEVFRCPHPPPSLEIGAELRVSLGIGAANATPTPIPSLASYRPPRVPPAHGSPAAPRSLICACTMVYDAAKFLGEWVAYHAAIGVERFFLYDNGGDDDAALDAAIRRLSSAGHHVSSRYWPWPKTQEAAFSHCAAVHRDTCRWMAFVDVDEFVFSPDWAGSARPNRSMLGSLLPARPNIGQLHIRCYEFGPSGLSAHPKPGVTQGYTCRRRAAERHKSLVRLDAVDRSLANSVHHFLLKDGFRTKRVIRSVRVNHYKYQAWDEFKVKFRRRASAFVADWSTAVNPGSKDRTPGLGFKALEPAGWTQMFCEVRDFQLRDATRRWFGVAGPRGTYKMVWE